MLHGMDEVNAEQGAADAGKQGAVLAMPPLEAAERLSRKAPETPRGENGNNKDSKINKEEGWRVNNRHGAGLAAAAMKHRLK